jgi:hypothetical protein
MQSIGLLDLPTLDDLRSVVCDIIPYCNSYTYVPRRNKLRRIGFPEEHADLHHDVIELTEDQDTPDWFIARRFVLTSTTSIDDVEVSLIGIDDVHKSRSIVQCH